jgi:hypothetical protein
LPTLLWAWISQPRVILIPACNFPNHGRIIHPTEGAAGFTPENLEKLSRVFTDTMGVVLMTEPRKVDLIGPDDSTLAELLVADEEEGWFTGRVVRQSFPSEVEKALAWYDEVIRDQMLSYRDEAVAAVQGFDLRARFPDGSMQKTYSLHVSPSDDVSFRIEPVLSTPGSP